MTIASIVALAEKSGAGLDISYRRAFDSRRIGDGTGPPDPNRLASDPTGWPWPWRVRLIWNKNERSDLRLVAYAPTLGRALEMIAAEAGRRRLSSLATAADAGPSLTLVHAAAGYRPRPGESACPSLEAIP